MASLWTKDSAKASDLGTFEIVDGKDLSYNNQSSNPNTTGALVSEAFASANNLKVGDTLEVAAASDAKTTAKLKVRGIYKYTSESAVANPVTRPQPRERDLHQLSDLRQGRTRPTVHRQDRLRLGSPGSGRGVRRR